MRLHRRLKEKRAQDAPHHLRLVEPLESRLVDANVVKRIICTAADIIHRRISNGEFRIGLVEGEEIRLRVITTMRGKKPRYHFYEDEVDGFRKAVEMERQRIILVSEMLEDLAKDGITIDRSTLIAYFKRKGCINNTREFEIDGKKETLVLRSGKANYKYSLPPLFMYREDFERFRKWIKANYKSDFAIKVKSAVKKTKTDVPDGYISLASAASKLGLSSGALPYRVQTGKLNAVMHKGILAIRVEDFERLQTTIRPRKVQEETGETVDLVSSLVSIGYITDALREGSIVSKGGCLFFKFKDYSDVEKRYRIYEGKGKRYKIAVADFEEIKKEVETFTSGSTFLDAHQTAKILGLKYNRLLQLLVGGNLILRLPDSGETRINTIERNYKRWFRKKDIEDYLATCRGIRKEIVYRKEIIAEMVIGNSTFRDYFGDGGIAAFAMNGVNYSISLKRARKKGAGYTYLRRSELDILKLHYKISRTAEYARATVALHGRLAFEKIDGRRLCLLDKISIPLEEVDGALYVKADYVTLIEFYLGIKSRYAVRRLGALADFEAITTEFKREKLELVKERMEVETDRAVKGRMTDLFGREEVAEVLKKPLNYGLLGTSVSINDLGLESSFVDLLESANDGEQIILSKNYGIAIPVDGNGKIDSHHVDLLLLFRGLSNSDIAGETAIKTLKELKVRNEIDLAKLWLCRDYYISKDGEGVQEKRIHRLLKKQDFEYYVQENSKIFTKGTPIADELAVSEWIKLMRGSPYLSEEVKSFLYPSSPED